MSKIRVHLNELSREELNNLIERMCQRHPDLFELLTAPTASSVVPDQGEIVARIRFAFDPAMRGGWREAIELSTKLDEIACRGRDYIECGEFGIGVDVLATLIGEVVDRYADIFDSEGEIANIIDRCVGDLDGVLNRIVGSARTQALDAILVASVFGQDYGVVDDGVRILVNRTADRERNTLAAEVSRMLAESSHESERIFLGDLLIRLRGDQFDHEARIEIHRSAENHPGWVEELLRLQRPVEAAEVLASVSESREVTQIADLFCRQGFAEHARRAVERIVLSRELPGRWTLLEWLYRHAADVRDSKARARWAEELFGEHPGLRAWRLVRESVSGADRTKILHQLAAEGQLALLTRILLSDGQPRRALTQYRRIPSRDRRSKELDLGSEVAGGIVGEKPSTAAELWLNVADHYAKRGHREDYEEAIRYVKLGYDALVSANHPVLATRYVAGFRKRHGRRKLLQEALGRAGLP